MLESGLRFSELLPKQVQTTRPCPRKEARVPRWLIIIGIIAVVAMVAGFLVFGGANMGH